MKFREKSFIDDYMRNLRNLALSDLNPSERIEYFAKVRAFRQLTDEELDIIVKVEEKLMQIRDALETDLNILQRIKKEDSKLLNELYLVSKGVKLPRWNEVKDDKFLNVIVQGQIIGIGSIIIALINPDTRKFLIIGGPTAIVLNIFLTKYLYIQKLKKIDSCCNNILSTLNKRKAKN